MLNGPARRVRIPMNYQRRPDAAAHSTSSGNPKPLRRRARPSHDRLGLLHLDSSTAIMATVPKRKWFESSASLRMQRIVELTLNDVDQTPRSPVSSRSPSLATSRRLLPSIIVIRCHHRLYHHSNVPDRSSASRFRVGNVDGYGTTYAGYGGVADGALEHNTTSHVLSNLAWPVSIYANQPVSTLKVVTLADIHVSAGDEMTSSFRIFRVSSSTQALLNPKSGSDSEYSDEGDVEHHVTFAQTEV
ncbi:hypothetical protein EVAR_65803_1 [Eumeta japonica]|uniref:Uncharacterized protein n=1 Tax=Eumeta variegata TaxID=151549 RepID=A0A4C1ZTB2_EUMVA|nr:hypothetical protein EVAR_65803_1 [Eumeta japonica]